MCRWTGSALVQVMAGRLFAAKPLPEPKYESKYKTFHSRKWIWICLLFCEMAAILSMGRWVILLMARLLVNCQAKSSAGTVCHQFCMFLSLNLVIYVIYYLCFWFLYKYLQHKDWSYGNDRMSVFSSGTATMALQISPITMLHIKDWKKIHVYIKIEKKKEKNG